MGRILICDSCEVFRHGLMARLRSTHDVVTATSVEGLKRLAYGDDGTDLIIVDAVNGCRIRRLVTSLGVPILLLIDDSTPRDLPEALARIAPTSVLHRNAPMQTAIVAVDTTLDGGCYIDPALAVWHDGILDDLMIAKEFTAREREVCHTVLEGCRTSEVARRLGLSTHTVKHHLSRIYSKAEVSGRAELIELFSSSKWFR